MAPKASVITVCFNSESTIRKTIESLLNQTSSDFEYIIIDGLSTDSTLSIAEEYRDKFEDKHIPYRIYSEKDHGIYDAMDKGIIRAEGDVVGIINSDDWYEPNAIAVALSEYKKNPYDICMCSLYLWKDNKKRVKKPKIRRYKTSRDLCHPSMFVSKKGYRKIGLYDKKIFYGDFDFWLRSFRKKANICIDDAIVSNYRMGGVSNQKTLKKMMVRIKDRYHVYVKNGYSKLYLLESIWIELAKIILA